MARRPKKYDVFYNSLDKEEKKILDKFNSFYTKGTSNTYAPSIESLYNAIGKSGFNQYTYSDFLKHVKGHKDNSSIHNTTFFKFLFMSHLLINEKDFLENEGWTQQKIKEEFQKQAAKKKNTSVKLEPKNTNRLKVKEIAKLEKIISQYRQSESEEKMKIAFYWDMIFHCDIDKTLVQQFKAKDYMATTTQRTKVSELPFIVPEDYRIIYSQLFEILSRKPEYDGTSQVNLSIYNLGEEINFSKLTPTDISKARKASYITCPNCFRTFLNEASNWVMVQYPDTNKNYLVCKVCKGE